MYLNSPTHTSGLRPYASSVRERVEYSPASIVVSLSSENRRALPFLLLLFLLSVNISQVGVCCVVTPNHS